MTAAFVYRKLVFVLCFFVCVSRYFGSFVCRHFVVARTNLDFELCRLQASSSRMESTSIAPADCSNKSHHSSGPCVCAPMIPDRHNLFGASARISMIHNHYNKFANSPRQPELRPSCLHLYALFAATAPAKQDQGADGGHCVGATGGREVSNGMCE